MHETGSQQRLTSMLISKKIRALKARAAEHSLAKASGLAQHAVRVAAAGAKYGEGVHFGALLALEVVLVPIQRLGRHRRQELENLVPHASYRCWAVLQHLSAMSATIVSTGRRAIHEWIGTALHAHSKILSKGQIAQGPGARLGAELSYDRAAVMGKTVESTLPVSAVASQTLCGLLCVRRPLSISTTLCAYAAHAF